MKIEVLHGDCLNLVGNMRDESVDAIYLDPPFFSEKTHTLKTRDRTRQFSYDDLWGCHKKYAAFLHDRLVQFHRVLKHSGNIFVHCDVNATHIIRALLDDIFGREQFRSEIIWQYKRWSNSKKGLLPSHQTIYFFSKSDSFTFNTVYNGYSESTNIDQILQKRSRDEHGKAVYARDENGEVIICDNKKGVPLGDVWEIPYLNPKAKERVGYPTQKPILLLERILEIGTNPCDIVMDPFCGSGTTLVAAKLLGRGAIGIDSSTDAVHLANERLASPVKSESALLQKGREAYLTADKEALILLQGLDAIPVQRNRGIDLILKQQHEGKPILVRVQKHGETLTEAARLLAAAAETKRSLVSFLVCTEERQSFFEDELPSNIRVIKAPGLTIKQFLKEMTLYAMESRKSWKKTSQPARPQRRAKSGA